MTALAEGDDIASDNAVTNAVTVIDELKVLLVNGRPGLTGFERPTASRGWRWRATSGARTSFPPVRSSAEKVPEPVSARYAYDANPMERANLYGRESLLPAVPFSETVGMACPPEL